MNRLLPVVAPLLFLALAAPEVAVSQAAGPDTTLEREIMVQDSALFAAFNRCDTLALARYFAPDLEFYHDKTGLTRGTGKNVAPIADRCRRIAAGTAPTLKRALLPEETAVYPVPGAGAMQVGRHRFTQGAFEGQPPSSAVFGFLMLWERRGSAWQLTRIFSYDH